MSLIAECFECGHALAVGDHLWRPLLEGAVRHLSLDTPCDSPMGVRVREIRTAACHPSETCVVWKNPATGEVAYPPLNNVPMPERYRERGFERVEMRSIHEIRRFEKQHGVTNDVTGHDSNWRGL